MPVRPPVCSCGRQMELTKLRGVWRCPDGCGEFYTLDQEDAAEPADYDHNAVSLSFVPGSIKGGGSKSHSGKSPQKQKYEAWLRRRGKQRPLDT